MMHTSNYFGMGAAMHLHFVLGFILLLGGILLLMWFHKYAKEETLKNWAFILLAIGALGTVLTGGWGMQAWQMMMQ